MSVKRLLQGNRLQSTVALVVVSFLYHIIYFNTYFLNHAQLWQLLREALCKTFTNPDPHMSNGLWHLYLFVTVDAFKNVPSQNKPSIW